MPIEPQEFIDPDEGRELVSRAFYAEGEPCENCGRPCLDGRVHVPGFDFLGCNECAEEARAVIFAEDNCPTLYDAVMRSTSVQQVRTAMKHHEATCPNCNPTLTLRKIADVANMPSRVERKEAA